MRKSFSASSIECRLMDDTGTEEEIVNQIDTREPLETVEDNGLTTDVLEPFGEATTADTTNGIEVAPTTANEPEDDDDPMLFLELGDRVLIDSEKYGRTIGRIYYRDGELMRIMPDGVADRLYDFPRIYTEEEDRFVDELGVRASYVLEKAELDSFVEQQDIRVGQTIETLTAQGELGSQLYRVRSVEPEEDAIVLEDDTGADTRIVFGFVGIPLESSFAILRIRSPPQEKEDAAAAAAAADAESATEVTAEAAVAAEETLYTEEVPDIKIVGYVNVPKTEIYREAKASEKTYPDTIQKVDALNDFLNMLDPIAQKDPKAVREIRILVESLLYLKQATIEYNTDGSIRGRKQISVHTLAELLQLSHVPLSRPVLNVAQRLYVSPEDEENDTVPPDTDDNFFVKFNEELASIVANLAASVSSRVTTTTATAISTSPFWTQLQSYVDEYMEPWKANSVAPPVFEAKSDSDFFRRQVPDLESPSLPAYVPAPDFPSLSDIPFSLNRAVSATYRKSSEKRKVNIISADKASVSSYLIFPLKAAPSLGSTRSGSLATDSGRSKIPVKPMADILKQYNGAQDITTSNGILALGVSGNTLGNIPLKDYLEGIEIRGMGIGDARGVMTELGLETLEMTPDTLTTLEMKFQMYQNQLRSTLATLRERLPALEELSPESPLTFLENPAVVEETLRTEPILADSIVNFKYLNPTLSTSDVAQTAHLLRKYSDYFQVAMGKQPVYVAKERLRITRDMFIESLQIAKKLRTKALEKGEPPVPNRCEHVAKLRTIRKITDDTERYQLLTKFFARYQGDRRDNYIECNVCGENLLCLHERLQLQAFLNPKEADVITKDIILHFAGGIFSGNYICRNCGQPIEEISYDTHLEYDDEGRPLMGRSVLVDKDAIAQEELELVLGAPLSKEAEVKFETDLENTYYKIIREIAERVGIYMDKQGYRRVIDRIQGFISRLPDRAGYARMKLKADYDVWLSQNTVCATAVFLLLEIQTKIPDYVVRYPLQGCIANFGGYPLGPETDRGGIEYIACAVSGILRDEAPWNQTGFQAERQDKKRQDTIKKFMELILSSFLRRDATAQQELLEKKKYLRETFGAEAAEGRPSDKIPTSFLPEQVILNPADIASAQDVTIPEVARMMNDDGASLVRHWIRQGHLLARKTASLVQGSPFSDTTCCLSVIQQPGSFWQSVSDLPKLPGRSLKPNTRVPFIQTHFTPRLLSEFAVNVPADLSYRIFLKICFQGPRKGLPHEPGLTFQCPWCGFQFPTHPSVLDTDTEGKTALVTQNIDTSSESFQELLDEVHRKNRVEPYEQHTIPSLDSVLSAFADIEPQPMQNWNGIIRETLTKFRELPPNANRSDVAIALGELSDATAAAEAEAKRRLVPKAQAILDELVRLPWSNWLSVIQAYFIVPFNRVISGFKLDSLIIPPEMKLSDDHFKDIKAILTNDMKVIATLGADMQKPNAAFARSKVRYFIRQMSAIQRFKNRLRALIIPGRSATLGYIQRALLYGPLSMLANPNFVPPGAEGTEAGTAVTDISAKLILNLIVLSLGKFMVEKLTFSDDQLRELITVRNEKEKMKIIKDLDDMTDESRAVALVQKRLGIGRWAVGGTSAIYAYDPEQYEREREERLKAGIIDFPGSDDAAVRDGRLQEFATDTAYERDGGYDHVQTREDDA